MKDLIVGDKEISELEQTLIENLNVYKNLVKRINSIQPKLCLTSILKENICWIIRFFENIKQDGRLIYYKIGWAKNTLKIISINLKKEIIIIIVNLVRNKLFHEVFTNNIKIHLIGVRNG